MKKQSTKEPVWWRWSIGKIEAALQDPNTPAHIRAEIEELARRAKADIENCEGMKLYRANKPLLREMVEAMPAAEQATLDELLAAADVVRSAASRKAAQAKPAPEWHAKARADADRLIAGGMAPRNVPAAIARKFECTDRQARAVLRKKSGS